MIDSLTAVAAVLLSALIFAANGGILMTKVTQKDPRFSQRVVKRIGDWWRTEPIRRNLVGWMETDPEKSLAEQAVLVRVIVFVTVAAALVAVAIYHNTELYLDLSASGFNFAAKTFSVPLTILAMLIPIIAVVASNHRSEQTKAQLRVSEAHNNFSNYYLHMREFTASLSDIIEKDNYNREGAKLVYERIFTGSRHGGYEIDRTLSKRLKARLAELIKMGEVDAENFDKVHTRKYLRSLRAIITLVGFHRVDKLCDEIQSIGMYITEKRAAGFSGNLEMESNHALSRIYQALSFADGGMPDNFHEALGLFPSEFVFRNNKV